MSTENAECGMISVERGEGALPAREPGHRLAIHALFAPDTGSGCPVDWGRYGGLDTDGALAESPRAERGITDHARAV
jgi:hypothetical protein